MFGGWGILTVIYASNPCGSPAFQVYPQFKIYDCEEGPKATFEWSASGWYKQWLTNSTYNETIAQEIADSMYVKTLRELDYYVPDPPH